uniref:Protein phosphatase 1 regulatory subunit 1A n=1 Tax=Cairina moschata TaxID=8855 RepID=A0A8C3BL77_CAIMO
MRPQHGTVPTRPPFPSRGGERGGGTQHPWVPGTPRPPRATSRNLLLLPSPEIDEDRLPNPLLKSGLAMSPRQRKKVSRTTPTMKELQMMVEHHLCKQAQGEEEEEEEAAAAAATAGQEHGPGCCHHGASGDTEHSHGPGGSCPLARAQPTHQGGPGPGESEFGAPSTPPGGGGG